MRRVRAKAPKWTSLWRTAGALGTIPTDEEPACELRESEDGRPNLRYRAVTNGLPWLVDIYQGHFYRVQVGNGMGEICRSIPALLGYLERNLLAGNKVD